MPYAKELDEILGEVAEADGEDVTIEQLKERIADLESAILVAHKTGMWGPIEDAYAAGGHPCLKHRQG